jgi:hypothetical protein
MDEIYRSLADQIIRERVREAAEWRLADQAARSSGSIGFAARLRRLVAGRSGQPAAAPTLTADGPACV